MQQELTTPIKLRRQDADELTGCTNRFITCGIKI